MTTRLKVNEIFISVQGEGARQGEPSIFVRLTGCNLRCRVEPGPRSPGGFDCDTEFVSGRYMTPAEVEYECSSIREELPGAVCDWVVVTGGEPLLQVNALRVLARALKAQRFHLALETNGSQPVPPGVFDWVAVSPKVAEHAVRAGYADELRYVRGYGQALPKPSLEAKRYFLSPAFDGDQIKPTTLEWVRQLCEESPRWELSIQQHKLQGVR